MESFDLSDRSGPKKFTNSRTPIIIGAIAGSFTVAITVITIPFLTPSLRRFCLPYIPSTTQQVSNILEALQGRSGNLLDLGSGDGRIVLAAAKQGFQSTGIELNPWLVIYSKVAAFHYGLHKKVKFYKRDLWKFDLKPYNNIVIHGVNTIMDELENKFINELSRGSCIVACQFPLTNLSPVKTIGNGVNQIWVYEIK